MSSSDKPFAVLRDDEFPGTGYGGDDDGGSFVGGEVEGEGGRGLGQVG